MYIWCMENVFLLFTSWLNHVIFRVIKLKLFLKMNIFGKDHEYNSKNFARVLT